MLYFDQSYSTEVEKYNENETFISSKIYVYQGRKVLKHKYQKHLYLVLVVKFHKNLENSILSLLFHPFILHYERLRQRCTNNKQLFKNEIERWTCSKINAM